MARTQSMGQEMNINEKIAEKVTDGIGSMWCAYAFAAIAVYGFPYANIHPVSVIQWISQEFLQLVLLSVIMVGQNVHAEKLDGIHTSVKEVHHAIRNPQKRGELRGNQ